MASKMKAWLYSSVSGGLENNLFQAASGTPKPRITDDQILVEVFSSALNPADYKVPELGLAVRPMISFPAIPGIDFCGRVAQTGNKVDSYRIGEWVFGSYSGSLGRGTLAQYVGVGKDMLTSMPEGVKVDHAASIGAAGLTAYQALKDNVKEGDKVFINGGSGGTGVWTIQIAKQLGCHVTTSCSAANVELCKSLGADEVLDYKKEDILKQLEKKGPIYHLSVDNVGDPANLYQQSHLFLSPPGKFVQVGLGLGFGAFRQLTSNLILPGFLGGGKRKYQVLVAKPNSEDFRQLGQWVQEGKIKAVIDETYEWEDTPKAFEKLKTGRAKGKIVVRVQNPGDQ
jgi:NADPH:quinone reductase-like Zn-dependent oxidoreductase